MLFRSALESELFSDETTTAAPNVESEQSLGEVFAAFREHVEQQISSDDYQTHYDLGIGYKEMGLVDEAIQEFEVAAGCAELHRDACTMIAVCHREREQFGEAATWYRKAIESPGSEEEIRNELRYELAEALLQAGDEKGALDEFRGLLEIDPSFRDVDGRVSELETRLGR